MAGLICAARLLPLDRQLDRQLCFGFEHQGRRIRLRLDPDSEPFRERCALDAPALRRFANGSLRNAFRGFSVCYDTNRGIDRYLVLFLEGPADGFLRREVDLHRHVEGVEEIAEDDAGALGGLIGAHAVPEAEAAQANVEEELRLRVGDPIVSDRRGRGRADRAGATEAEQGDGPELFARAEHRTVPPELPVA